MQFLKMSSLGGAEWTCSAFLCDSIDAGCAPGTDRFVWQPAKPWASPRPWWSLVEPSLNTFTVLPWAPAPQHRKQQEPWLCPPVQHLFSCSGSSGTARKVLRSSEFSFCHAWCARLVRWSQLGRGRAQTLPEQPPWAAITATPLRCISIQEMLLSPFILHKLLFKWISHLGHVPLNLANERLEALAFALLFFPISRSLPLPCPVLQ